MINHITPQAAKSILGQEDSTNPLGNIETQHQLDAIQRHRNTTQLMLEEWLDILKMRRRWSNWLLWVIIAVVAFDFFVVIAVGFGWMSFKEGYIVPFFVGESLIKTLGLAIIVVKFLFNEKFIKSKNTG